MLDVIESCNTAKYGDAAELSSSGGGSSVVGVASVGAIAPLPRGDGGHSPSRGAATGMTASSAATSSLNARGRAVTFYEEEADEDALDAGSECNGEDGCCGEEDEDDDDDDNEGQTNVCSEEGSCLKASLLDYVLSEVANHNQLMDLEHSTTSTPAPQQRPARRQYAYNPEEPQDVPPHLSEYYERNVIAVLNRCDPQTWGRCLSCGSGAPPEPLVQSSEDPESDWKYSSTPPPVVAASRGACRPVYQVEAFWSYYNYKNEFRTLGVTAPNHTSGHSHINGTEELPSAPTSPWLVSSGNPSAGGSGTWEQHFFPSAEGEDSMERSRCNSDLSSGADIGTVVEMDQGEDVFTFDARLLSDTFLSRGRVDYSIQLMAYHPDYLEIFLRTHHFLMRGDGPLPYIHRNYIAIMAAARYRCGYLMELQKRDFLAQGGDPNWLRGLDHAPPKLVALYTVNKIMAHRPWVLKKEDLQHLTKKAGWSLSEVVQAVVLLAHFHSLSSFIHGCGIAPEVEQKENSFFLSGDSRAGTPPKVIKAAPLAQGSPRGTQFPVVHPAAGMHVSFAGGPPSILTTTNNLSCTAGLSKQTKSILKKTECILSTSPGSSPSSKVTSTSGSSSVGSSHATSGGINVPSSVHYHPYHSHHRSSSHSHHQSPCGSLTRGSPVMKSDALHNCLGSGAGSGSSSPRPSSSFSEVDIILATMKNLSETCPIEDPEERKKRFETVARSDLDTSLLPQKENIHPSYPLTGPVKPHTKTAVVALPTSVVPFISEPEYTYEDFIRRGQASDMHTFRIQDYSWEEHGYSLVNRLYAEVGQIIDDKFKVAQNMTYYSIGGRANVDTTKFRTAVWNYIQCLYGIRHDDYDYGEVNQLLERPLKAFIKTVCCYPERITQVEYDNVMREFKHSEKVHVNLMIVEAKLQAELLYALRTVMKLLA